MRHRVACIHDKIHDHLFELTSVGLHRAPLPHRADLELDLRTDQPAKHGCQIADDRVEVEHHRRQNLSTAESEKLPRQVGRVTARVENLDHICVRWIVRRQTLDDVLAEPDDHCEQVAEVVGNAARQQHQWTTDLTTVVVYWQAECSRAAKRPS